MPRTYSRRALLVAGAGLALSAGLAACGATDDPRDVEYAAATEQFADPNLLAGADWLADRIDDPSLRLVDCAPIRRYRRGHLPGARHIWWQDTIEVNNPVYGMLTGAPGRAKLVRAANITPDATVVCYDDRGGVYAARVIWMLHAVGFFQARLLDGGRQAWTASGYDLTRARADTGHGAIIETPNEAVNAHGHDIAARLGEPGLAILDTRTAGERRETWYDTLRRGAIPGSHWLPRDDFLNPDPVRTLVTPETLWARLEGAGVARDVPEIIVYGLHGTLAALPYVALRALGVPKVRLYDGAWAEWGTRTEWPIVEIA